MSNNEARNKAMNAKIKDFSSAYKDTSNSIDLERNEKVRNALHGKRKAIKRAMKIFSR